MTGYKLKALPEYGMAVEGHQVHVEAVVGHDAAADERLADLVLEQALELGAETVWISDSQQRVGTGGNLLTYCWVAYGVQEAA